MPQCPHCNEPLDIFVKKAVTHEELILLLDQIGDTRKIENIADADFVNNIRSRYAKFKDKTRITVPQRDWLARIAREQGGSDDEESPF